VGFTLSEIDRNSSSSICTDECHSYPLCRIRMPRKWSSRMSSVALACSLLLLTSHMRSTEPSLLNPLDSVMGATGSGKSTVRFLPKPWPFFGSAVDCPASSQCVSPGSGHRLHSSLISSADSTSALAEGYDPTRTPYNLRVLDRRRVVLIDTPGFDDTARSDTDVLKMITAFLETS